MEGSDNLERRWIKENLGFKWREAVFIDDI
jgi:hypothetical protein